MYIHTVAIATPTPRDDQRLLSAEVGTLLVGMGGSTGGPTLMGGMILGCKMGATGDGTSCTVVPTEMSSSWSN